MAILPTHVKCFIVQELACFRAPSEVAHDVTTAFGLQIDRRQVWKYTPARNPRLAPRWRAIFAATRSKYLRDIAVQPMAHLSFRLDALLRLARKAEGHGLDRDAALIFEQAAKEVGGLYTNLRKIEDVSPRKALAKLLGIPEEQLPTALPIAPAEA